MKNLDTVDERLQILAKEVIRISPVDFAVTEGIRTRERQAQLYREGKTKTLNSKHLEGKAIDICPVIDGKLDYSAADDLFFIVGLFYAKAIELKGIYDLKKTYNLDTDIKGGLDIKIITGALWLGESIKNNIFIDGYHIELA
jgi:peptidoglycan L-alanyl-D-glutamate endopeptidase CwlK